jgi:hypothetical protein
MTTLTLRYHKGYFVVSGPDTQPTRFRYAPGSERLVPYTASLGNPSGWLGPHGRRMNQT